MPVLGHLNRHLGLALWVLILSVLSVSPAYGQVALATPKDAGSTVEAEPADKVRLVFGEIKGSARTQATESHAHAQDRIAA